MNIQPHNLKDGKRVAIMHGECYLEPVDHVPAGKTGSLKEYIVGHSESCHNHVLKGKRPFQVI